MSNQLESDQRVRVRRATSADCRSLWLWANDATTRENSLNATPIAWLEHVRWFQGVRQDPEQWLLISCKGNRALAAARLKWSGDRAEISLNVCPDVRGRGIGQFTLGAVKRLIAQDCPPCDLWARIKPHNGASLELFARAGFAIQSEQSTEHSLFLKWENRQSDQPVDSQ